MAASALERWSNNALNLRAQPREADTTAPEGRGISTAQLSNPNAAMVAARGPGSGSLSSPDGPPWAKPVPVWLGLVGLMVAYHFVEQHPNSGIDKVSILHISVGNLTKVTLMAVIGLNLGKWILGYWKVPGVSDLFLAA